MTTAAIISMNDRCSARIASGMGKTFVVIALSRYFSRQGNQVLVILANELLFE
jgi:hypothetical protein